MAIENTGEQNQAFKDLAEIENRAASVVSEIENIGTAANILRDKVQADPDNVFDPQDFGFVNGAVNQLKAGIVQAAALL